MDYAKIYQTLINKAKQRTVEGYSESHHIIPRCMGGSDTFDNLVRLTPEEHFVAHLLLMKMYPTESKLAFAAIMMTASSSNVKRPNNKCVGWLRREVARNMKKNNPMKRSGVAQRVANIRRERGNLGRRCKVSEHEVKALSERMKDNNPCSKLAPWLNNRATPVSLDIWKNADAYYQWWCANKKGYCAMATAFGFKEWSMSHQNMVKKFKSGWIPKEDPSWLSWTLSLGAS